MGYSVGIHLSGHFDVSGWMTWAIAVFGATTGGKPGEGDEGVVGALPAKKEWIPWTEVGGGEEGEEVLKNIDEGKTYLCRERIECTARCSCSCKTADCIKICDTWRVKWGRDYAKGALTKDPTGAVFCKPDAKATDAKRKRCAAEVASECAR
jgi:hypothetical protein